VQKGGEKGASKYADLGGATRANGKRAIFALSSTNMRGGKVGMPDDIKFEKNL